MVSEVADNVGYAEVELSPSDTERNGADADLDIPTRPRGQMRVHSAHVWYSQAAKPGKVRATFRRSPLEQVSLDTSLHLRLQVS